MISRLINSSFFKGYDENIIREILNAAKYNISNYEKNEIIYSCGDKVEGLLIVIKGNIRTEMLDSTGNTFRMEDIFINQVLGPGFLYGDNNSFPVDVIANVESSIMCIRKESFEFLLSRYPHLMVNYLDLISNKTQFLAKKIKNVFLQPIEGKIAIYLLSQIKSKNSLKFEMDNNQTWLAERFNVARPSVARVFKLMRDKGIISTNGKELIVLNAEKLRECIC